MKNKTMEQYLRNGLVSHIIDYEIRVTISNENRITFYIHPKGKDGETLDFEVKGNILLPNKDIVYSE